MSLFVELTYFRARRGTLVDVAGSYQSQASTHEQVLAEVREMQATGTLPAAPGVRGLYVLVETGFEDSPRLPTVQRLLIPDEPVMVWGSCACGTPVEAAGDTCVECKARTE